MSLQKSEPVFLELKNDQNSKNSINFTNSSSDNLYENQHLCSYQSQPRFPLIQARALGAKAGTRSNRV